MAILVSYYKELIKKAGDRYVSRSTYYVLKIIRSHNHNGLYCHYFCYHCCLYCRYHLVFLVFDLADQVFGSAALYVDCYYSYYCYCSSQCPHVNKRYIVATH